MDVYLSQTFVVDRLDTEYTLNHAEFLYVRSENGD